MLFLVRAKTTHCPKYALIRLIAMLEPQAEPDAIAYVKKEILGAAAYTNDYVPQCVLDDEVFPVAEAQETVRPRSEQQQVDVYCVEDYNPNDPRNW